MNTPADLILSHSFRLTPHIMSPVSSGIVSSDISLSDRMDEWISRQHTLLVAAQETQLQSDQHKVVENDAEITVIFRAISFFPSIKDHIKLEDRSNLSTSLKI